MEYTVFMEVEQGSDSARVCLNYWEQHLPKPAIDLVRKHLEDSPLDVHPNP